MDFGNICQYIGSSAEPCVCSFQSPLLDLYVKSVLMSKTRPQQHILDKSGSLMRHVSHSEFKELLLPAMQKTMLRSPENAMQSEMLSIDDNHTEVSQGAAQA